MNCKNIDKILVFVIFTVIFIAFSQAVQVQKEYILLEFKYENGNFSLVSKSIEKGNYPNPKIERAYQFNLLSDENKILYATSFDPSLLYSDYGNMELEGGIVILNKTNFFVSLPNYEETGSLQIVKDNKIIFEEGIYDVGAKKCRIR